MNKKSEFHQLIRQLARVRRSVPLGRGIAPSEDVARFRSKPSLAFPANAADEPRSPDARKHEDDRRPVVPVHFMGFFGPTANLPWHYAELAIGRSTYRDRSFRDFVDLLLQQRAVSFFHAVWQKYRLPIAIESEVGTGRRAGFEEMLRALVGLSFQDQDHRLTEGVGTWLYFAGHFSREQRSSAGLEAILGGLLDLPVRVEQFVGCWRPIPAVQQTRLGNAMSGQFNELGRSFVLGHKTWDVQTSVRVVVGRITHQQREDLLASGHLKRQLTSLIQSYLGPDFDAKLVTEIDSSTIRPVQLMDSAGQGDRLGHSSWLGSSGTSSYQDRVPI